ncbi:hypothetical protein [Nocardia aurantia]|uniref:hypothetical protein n=1 Tax=Nocardia aurantia TaxID=2585199 RepID=UPI001297E9B9|nr:hypothetical protein [Nocardia aurantia]
MPLHRITIQPDAEDLAIIVAAAERRDIDADEIIREAIHHAAQRLRRRTELSAMRRSGG